jgi:hypothetical protein
MLFIRGEGRLHRIGPADPLQPRWDLGVIQVPMVTAVIADDLEDVGVAAFCPALHDADRLAPQ